MILWEIETAAKYEDIAQLRNEGWEPFAVSEGGLMPIYHFRRLASYTCQCGASLNWTEGSDKEKILFLLGNE